MNVSTHNKIRNELDAPASAREIYFFYHSLDKHEKKGNFKEFFNKLDDLDRALANHTIFMELDSVLQYSRFLDANHAVLKAYVPQTAIEGRSDGLVLKKGALKKNNIHGCYPGWAKGSLYIQNPHFENKK